MATQSQRVSVGLEKQLRAYFQDESRFLRIYRTIHASATQAGVVVHVVYSDGRWSDTTFVGESDLSDVDDMMGLLILELTQNGLEVFERIGDGNQPLDLRGQGWGPAEPFQATFHQREPAGAIWELNWIPEGPLPSLKLPEEPNQGQPHA